MGLRYAGLPCLYCIRIALLLLNGWYPALALAELSAHVL